MTLAVVRSIGTPRRLETAQEYEDFEQELVDQFLLAGVGAGLSDDSIADDRRAIFEFVRFLGRPVWATAPEDADRFLAHQRKVKRLAHSTVQSKAWTLAQFFDFLIARTHGNGARHHQLTEEEPPPSKSGSNIH
ncbi:integrase [Streptomyces sp. NPDC059627]